MTMHDLLKLEDQSQEDLATLERISARQDAMLARTVEWAKVSSGSLNTDGLLKLAPIIAAAFEELDADVKLVPTEPIQTISTTGETSFFQSGPIISVRSRQLTGPRIVFTGHYDTVFAPGLFEEIKDLGDGRLNGPGLTDMKGGLNVMLEALRAHEEGPYKGAISYEIVVTPDEETGNFASADALKAAAAEADLGMTYEPAMETGHLAGARKGSAIFDCVFHGRAAHAGRNPQDGRNAIIAAAEFATQIDALNGQKDGVTFNVGKIDGGGPVNIVPETAIVRFGVRAPDNESAEWATGKVKDRMTLALMRDGITGDLHGGFYRPPKPRNAAQNALIKSTMATARALDLDLVFSDTGGVCEGNNVFAAGTPNIDTLGVRGGQIHSIREYLIVESLSERAALSAFILNRICDGRLDPKAFKPLMDEA